MLNDLDLSSGSPSLNLTHHQHEPPIFTSTPLVAVEKSAASPSSASSSFFLPLTGLTALTVTENAPNPNPEQWMKLNEDLCLLGLFDFLPSTLNIDQTLSVCRQLVKNYHQLAHDKHLLHEQLKKHQSEQIKHEKQEDVTKHDINRLQTKKERLSDDLEKYLTKINQLMQINQTKDKEIRRLNLVFHQQNALAKHQYRTLEKQIDKLKERVLYYEKNRLTASTLDYSWPLSLNETIIEPPSSPSEILLKKICHDYDQKHRLLMIENDQLRQCLIEINRQLERLLLIHRLPTESLPDILNGDTESFETQLIHLPCEAVYEIVQRHFAKLYEQIDRYMLHDH